MKPGDVAQFVTGVAVIGGVFVGLYALTGQLVASGAVPQWTTYVVAAGLLLFGVFRLGPVREAFAHGHGHGTTLLRHEAGHLAAAEGEGLAVKAVRVGGGSGYVELKNPDRLTPEQYLTFMLAGRYAAGTGAGCSADNGNVRAERRRMASQGMTRAQISAVERRAHSKAKSYGRSSRVDAHARKLAGD